MRLYGLIGHPLGHSFSKDYFNDKFLKEGLDCTFVNFDIEDIDETHKIISQNIDLRGFTVTYPYKNSIISHLDDVDDEAAEIGAVNVVKITNCHKLIGYNTDHIGFSRLFDEATKNRTVGRALVCGTGGASHAVQHTLKNKGIDTIVVSRNPKNDSQISYQQLNDDGFKRNDLIINATPIGMHPHENECLDIPYDSIDSSNILIDLIYNPEETIFLKKGKIHNALISNGLKMLYMQADAAWDIWCGDNKTHE